MTCPGIPYFGGTIARALSRLSFACSTARTNPLIDVETRDETLPRVDTEAAKQCASSHHMTNEHHAFKEGDRVRAALREGFPAGTVIKVLELGFILIRWDGDVLETAHHRDLIKLG